MKRRFPYPAYVAMGFALTLAPVGAQSRDQSGQTDHTTSHGSAAQTGQNSSTEMKADRSTSRQQHARTKGSKSRAEQFLHKAAMSNHMEVQMARMAQEKASSQSVKDYARKLESDHSRALEQLRTLASSEGVTLNVGSGNMMGHGGHHGAMDHGSSHSGSSTTGSAAGSTSATTGSSHSDTASTGTATTANESGSITAANTETRSQQAAGRADKMMHSGKHDAKMSKMMNLSGDEFDRAFIQRQMQHHQKDIQEFERVANNSAMDGDIRQFAQQTLPTLREHLRMAQDIHTQIGGTNAGMNKKSNSTSSGQ